MILLAIIPILLLLLIVVYVCNCIRKISFLNKIGSKYTPWIIVIIFMLIIILVLGYVDYFVIVFHLALFFGIAKFFSWIIQKIFNKRISYDYLATGVLIFTIIYFGIGLYYGYHVFETKYEVFTDKEIGNSKFRIVQLSDLHLGTTFDGKGLIKYVDRINKLDADIVVITGDFIDDDTKKSDMIDACVALGNIKSNYGVYFVYGNHDMGYFNYRDFDDYDFRGELRKNNVNILEDTFVELGGNIYLVGRFDKININRKSIDELVTDLDKSKYIIDLNHQPNDYENEKNAGVDLVLSGHSHGGQMFPLGYVGLLIGANDRFYGMEKRDNTTFIVNSGLSSWAMDFKIGAKSEYVVVDIIKKTN